MQTADKHESLKTLQEIHSIMDRSARFLSLSGWSGVWAGMVALAGAFIAYGWVTDDIHTYEQVNGVEYKSYIALAVAVLLLAVAGAYFFTARKAKSRGHSIWDSASRQFITSIAIPLLAGGIFSFMFLYNGDIGYIAPACLVFYGLALINGSKFTLSDIRYLGMLELVLGCVCLFMPGYGLYFWAAGFGALHVLYGAIVWNKYDKHPVRE